MPFSVGMYNRQTILQNSSYKECIILKNVKHIIILRQSSLLIYERQRLGEFEKVIRVIFFGNRTLEKCLKFVHLNTLLWTYSDLNRNICFEIGNQNVVWYYIQYDAYIPRYNIHVFFYRFELLITNVKYHVHSIDIKVIWLTYCCIILN